ncbi:MAG: hypothetical protein K5668_11890 [Lachnospiraceae bacterium]|nr:hypothetical protein [Lachnospiraceae bacterium]
MEELIENRYKDCEVLPEPDISFLQGWDGIIELADKEGAEKALNESLCAKRPVTLRHPEDIKIEIYDSFAGKIPVIYVRDTDDFEELVIKIAHKGVRPANLSETGAVFLSGKTIRFIILSAKPYSNVPAEELGLDSAEWLEKSLYIRREHECTHYYTRQTYGQANNMLHDELMADFTGLYETFGFYRAEWFLRFMGVIEGGGNRMVYYTKEISDDDRESLSSLLRDAAFKLEAWSETEEFKALTTGERIRKMCKAGLKGIAGYDG